MPRNAWSRACCCAVALVGFLATGSSRPAEPVSFRLQSFHFTSDHGLTGAPLSHTAGAHVYAQAELHLVVSGIDREMPCELQGNSAEPAFCFHGKGKLTADGTVAIGLTGANPLGPAVRKI